MTEACRGNVHRAQIPGVLERIRARFCQFGTMCAAFLWFNWTDHVNLSASSD